MSPFVFKRPMEQMLRIFILFFLRDISLSVALPSCNGSCHVMGNECHYCTAASLSGFVCSMLIILHLFSTYILPIERNIIYYNYMS